MSNDWEKTLPKELQDYIESQRQAARAAAIAEIRLGSGGVGKTDGTTEVSEARLHPGRVHWGSRQPPRGR